MHSCKCPCHDEPKPFAQKALGFLANLSLNTMRAGIWAGVVTFIMAGSISSMMILVKMYPELSEMILPFLTLSGNIMLIAVWGLGLGLFFSFLYWLFYSRGEKKLKGGNK